MSLRTSLVLLLLALAKIAITGNGGDGGNSSKCFFPDGSEDDNGIPCFSNDASSRCCSPDQFCSTNKLCVSKKDQSILNRGSCLDQNFGSTCPNFCKGFSDDGKATVLQCGTPSLGTFCCDEGKGYACCSSPSKVFTLGAISTFTEPSISSTKTSTSRSLTTVEPPTSQQPTISTTSIAQAPSSTIIRTSIQTAISTQIQTTIQTQVSIESQTSIQVQTTVQTQTSIEAQTSVQIQTSSQIVTSVQVSTSIMVITSVAIQTPLSQAPLMSAVSVLSSPISITMSALPSSPSMSRPSTSIIQPPASTMTPPSSTSTPQSSIYPISSSISSSITSPSSPPEPNTPIPPSSTPIPSNTTTISATAESSIPTTTPTPIIITDKPSASSTSKGAITGVAIGSAAGLTILISLAVIFLRKRAKRRASVQFEASLGRRNFQEDDQGSVRGRNEKAGGMGFDFGVLGMSGVGGGGSTTRLVLGARREKGQGREVGDNESTTESSDGSINSLDAISKIAFPAPAPTPTPIPAAIASRPAVSRRSMSSGVGLAQIQDDRSRSSEASISTFGLKTPTPSTFLIPPNVVPPYTTTPASPFSVHKLRNSGSGTGTGGSGGSRKPVIPERGLEKRVGDGSSLRSVGTGGDKNGVGSGEVGNENEVGETMKSETFGKLLFDVKSQPF